MDGAAVDFALTRFEAVDGARLEVEGTWSGVRGVRFVRPALVVRPADEDGSERTLLATLEHKPWPAEEGRPWVAAFPWDDAAGAPDVGRIELAVAPSIVVPLGRAEADAVGLAAARPSPSVPPSPSARGEAREAGRLAAAVAARDAAREERDAARARLAELAAERDRLAAAAQAAREEIARRPDRETVRGELRQRDAALAARDAAQAERDAAVAAHAEVVRERDALRRELHERDQAADGAARRREQALEERDAARRELEAAQERAAERERARAAVRIEEVEDALAAAEAERDRALTEPAGVAAPTPVARLPREHEVESAHADRAARAAAILALLVLLVLAFTLLRALW